MDLYIGSVGIYRLFSYVPISIINGNQDISQVINMAVYRKLHDLEYWEGALLIPARNNYLGEMKRVIIGALQIDLESIRTMFDDGSMDQEKIKIIHNMVNKSKEEFNECCNEYKEEYKKHWLEKLKLLNEECCKSKELEMIRSEIEELLKESEQQYRLLGSYKSNKVKPDEVFVQPILKYTDLAKKYYKFILKLCEDIRSCFYKWGPLGGGFDSCALDKQKFVVGNNETEFITESKKYMKELSHNKLSEFLSLMINYYCYEQNEKELREEIDKYYRKKVGRKEIGNVLIFALDRLAELYQEEFKQEETWFEKEKKKAEEAEKEAERISEALARAEEGKVRAELKDRTRKALMRQVCKLDSELQDIVLDCQDEVVEAVVNYAMEHRQHPPEPIVSTVMEEIKLNREQVIKEGMVNAGLINAGIRSFLTDVSVEPGCSSGMGRS
ncbi:hypothetical protein [Candidatus Mesenet endosymbiont of Agriotes lineatus]|uniref:hypothetical protein n=1 Tax=Candidatus Mesenet endosymbiont of Agriotes lineatus TaxID=3077948 RepID=UPI0030D0CB14